nr:RNA-directed DNA polymerase, eukaryota, reverse transcriptase zinc-binding domain protein [Tanacetum cinerariifolium]
MVVDDSCMVTRDLEFFVMGEVKKFSSILNLRVLLSKEGFQNVKVVYLGGLWVMFELESLKSKAKFMQHVGVASWAKELFAWSLMFNEVKEVEYCTDDESVQGTNEDKGENLGNEHNSKQPMNDKEKSQDPFNFYDLLRKHDGGVDTLGSDISIPYPPGFTPEKLNNNADVHEVKDMNTEPSECRSEGLCSRVLEEVQHTDDLLSFGVCSNGHMPKKEGSVLEVLDKMIKVGQTMGYTMEGLGSKAKKDWTRELIGKHKVNFLSLQETKMESISEMDVKILWGNSNFKYLFSEAVGNSSGILCTWDPNIFLKEQHILSDNFVAFICGFEQLVIHTWNSTILKNSNGMVRFKKKLQALKKAILEWVAVYKREQTGRRNDIKLKLSVIDKQMDQGRVNDDILLSRIGLMKQLLDSNSSNALDNLQKAKIQWAIAGDENSKFFHGVINQKQANLAIRGAMVDAFELEKQVSTDEIRTAVWACGENKSPGPDGFTFEFFRKFWDTVGPDLCLAVECLIGSLYKVVTKILALRLSSVIAGLISDVQTAFLPSRQILDGPFVINELLSWCKHKKQHAMIFKLDFAKAYDSVRWDFLDDVLQSFGLGFKWRFLILGSLSSRMASVLVNESPTAEFQFHCGLKQGDPLAPYLFILVMESLYLSFFRIANAGIFKSIRIENSTVIAHLFYADDAVFVGVGIPNDLIVAIASMLGCSIMKTPFKYLGVTVGGNMSNISSWDDIISKPNSRLSKWKVKTLSIRGRLTLLKPVLGSTHIYWMSLYKVPKSVLNSMEAISKNFFNGAQDNDKKITWVKWTKWVWRYISHDNSLWYRVISAIHGPNIQMLSSFTSLIWNNILKEVNILKDQGVDLISHLSVKLQGDVEFSLRRQVKGGVEAQQLVQLQDLIGSLVLVNDEDRWFWDLNGNGVFCVKDVRRLLDESFLPKQATATRWVKFVPIKINVFAWKVSLDRLPIRVNLMHRGFSLVASWFLLRMAIVVQFHQVGI